MKDSKALNIKAKCIEVFEQMLARYSKTGILNSCSGFRLGWEIIFRPVEECVVIIPDEYDSLNDLEVGNYDQIYYIEKEDV